VFVGGGEGRSADYDIFRPDYGIPGATKPTQVSLNPPLTIDPDLNAPTVEYGDDFRVIFANLPQGEFVNRAVLIAPGATTHHFDSSQRYHEMVIKKVTGPQPPIPPGFSAGWFRAPANDKLLPRGAYMMFLRTNRDQISAAAAWVAIR
jgi:hypothetical protein